MNRLNNLLVIILLTRLLASCESTIGEPAYLGTRYFPHEPGNWKVYRVDSIVYDDFLGEIFNYSYQVKEVNQGYFTDTQGKQRMRLERFYRKESSETWRIKNVWTSMRTNQHAFKTEENNTFLKLVFPVKRNLTWNGNQYNALQQQNYRITDIHKPAVLGNLQFDSTLTVMQKDFSTLIGQDLQFEIYASGVGMIFRKNIALQKEIDGTIRSGVDYTYTLLEYGHN